MLNLVLSVIALSIVSISLGQEKQQPTRSESPIFCNLNALTKEQRQRHKALSVELRTAVQGMRELPDGYAFRLPSDEAMMQKTMEWVVMERRCCPFIAFALEIEREGGPLWLKLSGREGVKPFLKLELNIP